LKTHKKGLAHVSERVLGAVAYEKNEKESSCNFFLALASVMLLSFAFIPATSAYGKGDNWQIGAAGTGSFCVSKGVCGGFGFWGWCAFAGIASGTSGNCQFSQYLHKGTPLGVIQCETSFDVTNWNVSATTNDFVINSGTVTFKPASSTGGCITLLAGAGIFITQTGRNTGEFSAPSDLGIPAVAGHYDLNGVQEGPITFTELQYQVSFSPH
jgi:hypothetical protein